MMFCGVGLGEVLSGKNVMFFDSAKRSSVASNRFYRWQHFKNRIFWPVINIFPPFVQQEILLHFSE
jgi:hypothetical protein